MAVREPQEASYVLPRPAPPQENRPHSPDPSLPIRFVGHPGDPSGGPHDKVLTSPGPAGPCRHPQRPLPRPQESPAEASTTTSCLSWAHPHPPSFPMPVLHIFPDSSRKFQPTQSSCAASPLGTSLPILQTLMVTVLHAPQLCVAAWQFSSVLAPNSDRIT